MREYVSGTIRVRGHCIRHRWVEKTRKKKERNGCERMEKARKKEKKERDEEVKREISSLPWSVFCKLQRSTEIKGRWNLGTELGQR